MSLILVILLSVSAFGVAVFLASLLNHALKKKMAISNHTQYQYARCLVVDFSAEFEPLMGLYRIVYRLSILFLTTVMGVPMEVHGVPIYPGILCLWYAIPVCYAANTIMQHDPEQGRGIFRREIRLWVWIWMGIITVAALASAIGNIGSKGLMNGIYGMAVLFTIIATMLLYIWWTLGGPGRLIKKFKKWLEKKKVKVLKPALQNN